MLKKNISECTLLKMLFTPSIAEVNVDPVAEHGISALKRTVISNFYFHISK